MDKSAQLISQMFPIPFVEAEPVRDDTGKIVDFRFVKSNNVARGRFGGDKIDDAVARNRTPCLSDFVDHAAADPGLFELLVEVYETQKPLDAVGSRVSNGHFAGSTYFFTAAPTETGCAFTAQDISAFADKSHLAVSANRKLISACDDAVHGIVLSSETGIIEYSNSALDDLLGFGPGELLGQHLHTIFHPEDREFDLALSRKLQTGELKQDVRDKTFLTKGGEAISVSVALSVTPGSDQNSTTYIGHVRDVRDERAASGAVSDALHKAEEATRLKSEFLANMSHEIRTPLNGVLGMAQALTYSNLDDDQKEQVATILESGKSLMSILNDILDLSKIEAGKLDLAVIEGDLRHKLGRVQKLFEPSAKEKGLSLRLFVDPSIPSRLIFDPVRVRQCVDNLVSNAIKFTTQGEILVAVTCEPLLGDNNMVKIHVADTGEGIAEDKLAHIFETFAQADGSTTRTHGGTGLGLPITRRLARIMEGDISVKSTPGKGSVFTLTFEAVTARNDTIDLDIEPDLAAQPVAAPVTENARPVLVVDDNGINRRVVRTFLEFYGLEIIEAHDGRHALEKLEKYEVDFVLMDIHMPEMDGIESYRRLRASDFINKDVPVIALTADSMRGDKEKYLGLGFTGYVSKPIDEPTLMQEISRCVPRYTQKEWAAA